MRKAYISHPMIHKLPPPDEMLSLMVSRGLELIDMNVHHSQTHTFEQIADLLEGRIDNGSLTEEEEAEAYGIIELLREESM